MVMLDAENSPMKHSRSEEDGLRLIRDTDRAVLSVGISTGGVAEMRMIADHPDRTVTATTLDEEGARAVKEKIKNAGKIHQVEVRVENIADPNMQDADETYDYIYARLVLHYLSKQELPVGLANMMRVLRPGGRVFVVVRSTKCEELRPENIVSYDTQTELTTYRTPSGSVAVRRFHTIDSITDAIRQAGFVIDDACQFDEDLSPSFNRDNGVWVTNNLIEVAAHKP